jgi:hypothetical protein
MVLMSNSESHTDETFLVHLPAVFVQAVRVVEPPLTESTHGVVLLHVGVQFALPLRDGAVSTRRSRVRKGEEFVLVSEDLLIGAAEVAQS